MRRVVITGIGAVTPLGLDAMSTWNAMREGRVAIGPIESVPREGLRAGIAAEVHGFDPLAYFGPDQFAAAQRARHGNLGNAGQFGDTFHRRLIGSAAAPAHCNPPRARPRPKHRQSSGA